MRGLERSRDRRWLSATAMADAIRAHLAGNAPVVCAHTACSRLLTGVGHLLDRSPRMSTRNAAGEKAEHQIVPP
jgi:hypothetical protein